MKKFKILSIILALLLTVSIMPTAFAADIDSPIFEVIGLNLNVKEDQPITRYDLAKMAISLGGLTVYETGTATYVDVPEKHWAFPAANTVTIYGYMGGLTDGTFSPNAEASIADAAQVLMNLLGYGAFGKQADWNTGDYLVKAKSIGLLNGVSITSGKLDVAGLKKMIINMLAENVVTISSIGAEGTNYVVDKEITYLQSRYGYYFKEGVMQAAGKSSLSGYSAVPAGKVKVDGVTYSAKGVDYSGYLGYEVRVIVDKNEENANLLYMEQLKSTEENEVYATASQIDDFSGYTLTYRDEDGKVEQAEISMTSQIFLNGQKTEFDERFMEPLSGSLKLLDTDGNGVYDIVYVTYELFYEVSGAFKDEYIVDAITGKNLNINKVEFSVYENGISTSVNSITNESVVAVMPGAITFDTNNVPSADNTTLTRASVETGIRKISGLVTAKGSEGCVIDGVEYSYSKYYTMLAANGLANLPTLNKDAIMYVNSENAIVYAKLDAKTIAANRTYKYAYLINAAPARNSDEKLILKMFTEDAKFISTETAAKFKFNGQNADAGDVLANATLFPNGTFSSQLVAYELEPETGLVSSISTATDYTTATDYAGYDLVNFSLESNQSLLYRNGFLLLYTFNSNSIVFVIPSDLSMEKDYKIKRGSSSFTYNTTYKAALYDADDTYNIQAAVIDYSKVGGSDLNARRDISINHFNRGIVTFIVEEKNLVLNAEGEEVYELTGKSHTNGVIEELKLTPTTNDLPDTDQSSFGHLYSEYQGIAWKNLVPGDVIHFVRNSNGYVERFRVVFRQESMKDNLGNIKYKTFGSATGTTFTVAGAVVRTLADGTILFKTAQNSSTKTLKKYKGSLMIYIVENGKARQGTASELRPGDSALFVCESGILYEMVVYRD